MKIHTKIFLFITLDTEWSKIFTHATINSVNHLYLIIKKINRYIEESNGKNCLTLVPTDESKGTKKV